MTTLFALLIPPVLFLLFTTLMIRAMGTKQETSYILRVYFLGCLLVVPVALADQAAHFLTIDGARSLRRMIVYSFLIVSFVSELSKFMLIRIAVAPKNRFRGPVEGILYTTVAAMGLATTYAIYYLFLSSHSGSDPAYMLSIGPANLILAILMGYFIGTGKLRKNMMIDSFTGLGAAVVFHGIFRFIMLSNDMALGAIFTAGSVMIVAMFIFRSFRQPAESK